MENTVYSTGDIRHMKRSKESMTQNRLAWGDLLFFKMCPNEGIKRYGRDVSKYRTRRSRDSI